ncbi:MAG: DUF58 domain-containing protein [Gammaproteobacteria bacterium]|nr:DUF58 domain-containing protein [Gammaproteobacteria bacterium]
MGLHETIRHLFHSVRHRGHASIVHQPLLNDIEIQQLQRQALSSINNPFAMNLDVQHQLLGERTSSYSGSGYEFAEHRRYANGDDMRFIDWRVMARTGKLYRKVFHEERRPQVYLVVDRRSPMRFATRTQLKVTCAIKQAIQLLYQARQQQLLSGSVILEETATWTQASQSNTHLHNLIQQLNGPCPPNTGNKQAELINVLNELAVRLTPGCIIYLISDFHDLDESASSVLYHLSKQHRLHALHVLDPAELALPSQGRFVLYDDNTKQNINIDSNDANLTKQFATDMQQRRLEVEKTIRNTGGDYRLLMTDEVEHG